jgi:hypothetical protein
MRWPATVLLCIACMALARPALSQGSCVAAAQTVTIKSSTSGSDLVIRSRGELRRHVEELAANPRYDGGLQDCVIAETKKRLGDTDAGVYFDKAIRADPSNAEFRLLFGDWLRNTIGDPGSRW